MFRSQRERINEKRRSVAEERGSIVAQSTAEIMSVVTDAGLTPKDFKWGDDSYAQSRSTLKHAETDHRITFFDSSVKSVGEFRLG